MVPDEDRSSAEHRRERRPWQRGSQTAFDPSILRSERQAEAGWSVETLPVINEPQEGIAERLASELGFSTARFYNLANPWATLRDPMALVGRRRPNKRHSQLELAQPDIIDS